MVNVLMQFEENGLNKSQIKGGGAIYDFRRHKFYA